MEEPQREENEFKCEYCEYSAHNFDDFGKHIYENHSAGGRNDQKEIVVDTKSISVQTEDTDLIICKECEHSENLKDSRRNFHIETDMNKEKVVDKKEVDVQTEPYFGVAVSVQTEKQEYKCHDCSENFWIKSDLMTQKWAIHKEKVKICRKFATRIHCPFGGEQFWYIHKESGTNNSLSKTEFECKVCGKVF